MTKIASPHSFVAFVRISTGMILGTLLVFTLFGADRAHAQSCSYSDGNTTYTCNGTYVATGGGGICYGTVTQQVEVVAECDGGGGGGGGGGFEVPPPAPTGMYATCNAQGTAINFGWNESPGATYYQPRVNPTAQGECSGAGWQLWAGDGQTCLAPGDQYYGTSVGSFPAIPGKSYSVWVHATNGAGVSDPTSIGVNCPAPVPQYPDVVGYVGGVVNATVNQGVVLYGSIYNAGTGAANNFPTIFQVCDGNCATYNVGLDAGYTSLGSGGSQQVSTGFTPPIQTQLYYRTCANVNTSWQNVISESDYGNNCSGWQYLNVAAQPNQAPQGSLDTATCAAGGIAGWAYDPDVASQAINVHVYLNDSYAATLSAGDYRGDLCSYLGTCNHGFNWTLPSQYFTGQTYSVKVYGIDAQGGSNPMLSNAPRSISCPAPVYPDLIGYVGSAVNATLNQVVTLYGSVGNSGTGNAGASTAVIEICDHNCATIHEYGSASVSALAPNGSQTVSVAYTVPTTAQMYYRTCADWFDAVSESNEVNNCSNWQTLNASPAPVPADLTANQIPTVNVTLGNAIPVSGTSYNLGGSTGSGFSAIFVTNLNTEATAWNTVLEGSPASPALPQSGSSVSGVTFPANTFSAPGSYYYGFCTDFNASWVGSIAESNEGNNCVTGIINVMAPAVADLVVGDIAPTTARVGLSQTFSATVTNNSASATSGGFSTGIEVQGAKGNPVAMVASGALAGNQGTSVSFSYTFASEGNYYARACTDWYGGVAESNEDNNCGPWTEISVSDVPIVTGVECVVSSTNIAPGDSVTYSAAGNGATTGPYSWLSPSGDTFSGENLTLTLDIPGLHDMTVSAADDSTAQCPRVSVETNWCTNETTVLSITATPARVRTGETTMLNWNATGVNGRDAMCTVTGPGVSWSGAVSAPTSCSVTSGAMPTITNQSTYTLNCPGVLPKTVTVNVIPNFTEF